MVAILSVIAVHLFARYHLNRAHPSHPLTLDLLDVTLREALRQSFPGTEIVFETDESKVYHVTLRVDEMSSVYVAQFMERLTETVIYRRGERIVVTRKSAWYRFFDAIDGGIYDLFGSPLWTSHGKP